MNYRSSKSQNAMKRALLSLAGVLAVSLPSAAQVNTTQDQIGRLTSTGTAQKMTFNEYDAAGRVVATQHVQDGMSVIFRTTYGYPQNPSTTAGLGCVVTGNSFHDGEVVTYAHDAGGNVVTVRSTFGGTTDDIVRDLRSNAYGGVTLETLGDGTTTTRQYNDNGDLRMKRTTTAKANNQVIQDYEYGYDDDGNVTATTDYVHPAESFTLRYDELGQMTAMLNPAGTTTIESYVYDPIGNLTQKGMVTQTYGTGGAAGRPHALDVSGGLPYSYDANGNVTAIGGNTTIDWNSENMPTHVSAGWSVADKSYVGEEQWKKVESGVTTYYLPSLRLENGVPRKFYGAYAERGGEQPGDRQLRFYHPDHLGSSSLVTDQGGTAIHFASYTPWGEDRVVDGPFTPKLQFNFKEKDASGFYDYGARLYNPGTGRWLSPDSSLADGFNRYAYVGNNPWTMVDPTGHFQTPAQEPPPPPPVALQLPDEDITLWTMGASVPNYFWYEIFASGEKTPIPEEGQNLANAAYDLIANATANTLMAVKRINDFPETTTTITWGVGVGGTGGYDSSKGPTLGGQLTLGLDMKQTIQYGSTAKACSDFNQYVSTISMNLASALDSISNGSKNPQPLGEMMGTSRITYTELPMSSILAREVTADAFDRVDRFWLRRGYSQSDLDQFKKTCKIGAPKATIVFPQQSR